MEAVSAQEQERPVGDPTELSDEKACLVCDLRIPWRGTAVRSRRSRSTQTFETETEAKDFARAKFDEGLVVTAGTIIPHLPRRAIPSGSIPSWLEVGREQDISDAAEVLTRTRETE